MRGDLGPEFGGFLGYRTCDGTALCFTFVIDDHSGIILAVDVSSVRSSPWSSLSDDDGWVNFLSEFLHTLLYRTKDYITNGTSG